MNIPNKKPTVANSERPSRPFNYAGFGKAGNNAISILIAKGYFTDKAVEEFDLEAYKELTKRIYKADLECSEELQR